MNLDRSRTAGLPLENNPAIPRQQHVYLWTDLLPSPLQNAADLLGAKAASLRQLFCAGYPVVPWFTITTETCRQYYDNGFRWPDALALQIEDAIRQLEVASHRKFGGRAIPLTLAIRSGATQSMPGLMPTFLHCGLTAQLAAGLNNDETWRAFAEFLTSYVPIRLGLQHSGIAIFNAKSLTPRQQCESWLQRLTESPHGPLSEDPRTILRDAITAVMDSWNSPGVRRFQDLAGKALSGGALSGGTAVTVQIMFRSEVSGVAFSCDPRSGDTNRIVVEALPGLGRTTVGGQATPHRWSLDRTSFEIADQNEIEQQHRDIALTDFVDRGLQPLGRAIAGIETIFQKPVDVEFGYADGELTFFQARPAGKAAAAEASEVRAAEQRRVAAWANAGRPLWVRHDLSDTLPMPTPLTWDVWRRFFDGNGGLGTLYRQLGYRPSSQVRGGGLTELIAGRIYVDPNRMVELYCRAYPLRFDPQQLREHADALHSAPTKLELDKLDPWFLFRWPIIVAILVGANWKQRRLANSAAADFDRNVRPRIGSWVEEQAHFDLAKASLSELISLFGKRCRIVMDEFAPASLLPGTLGALFWSQLQQKLLVIFGETQARTLQNELLARTANSTIERQTQLLGEIARGEKTLDEFLVEFGHRAPHEMELSTPRWREAPESIGRAARSLPHPLSSTSNGDSFAWQEQHLRAALESAGASCLQKELTKLLRQASNLLPYRETGKHEFLRAYACLRQVLTEIGRRTGIEDGVYFLTIHELSQLAERCDVKTRIDERRSFHNACRQIVAPRVIDGTHRPVDLHERSLASEAVRIVSATPLSRGKATGRVALLGDFSRHSDSIQDLIVVAETIDAAFVPYLVNAAGLIVGQGGMLSHVALLARQLNIPTLVHDRITDIVREGEIIRMDADAGRIEFMDRTV